MTRDLTNQSRAGLGEELVRVGEILATNLATGPSTPDTSKNKTITTNNIQINTDLVSANLKILKLNGWSFHRQLELINRFEVNSNALACKVNPCSFLLFFLFKSILPFYFFNVQCTLMWMDRHKINITIPCSQLSTVWLNFIFLFSFLNLVQPLLFEQETWIHNLNLYNFHFTFIVMFVFVLL